MTVRDDVIENAHHFHDAPKDCVVQYGPDKFVVTVTVEQAQALQAHLDALDHQDEDGEDGEDEHGKHEAAPAKRTAGRPRKTED